jgi:hypothetical protein
VRGGAANGFVRIHRDWKAGDVVRLELPMPVERVYAHPKVKADVGRVAIQRGPIVYCLEGADNGGQVRNLVLPRDAPLTATFEKELLRGVEVVLGEALAVSRGDAGKLVTRKTKFQAVPYSTWDNRKPGQMVVWLPESPELAEVPGEQGVKANGVLIQASHVNPTDTLAALNDGSTPKSSKDHSIPRMTWWDHKGTDEWLDYRFDKPRELSEAGVYWFDDTGIGGCRVPAEWRLLWKDGSEWKPVRLTGGARYGTGLNQFNRVTFEPVLTRELRMEVRQQNGFSGGVLKWTTAGPK